MGQRPNCLSVKLLCRYVSKPPRSASVTLHRDKRLVKGSRVGCRSTIATIDDRDSIKSCEVLGSMLKQPTRAVQSL